MDKERRSSRQPRPTNWPSPQLPEDKVAKWREHLTNAPPNADGEPPSAAPILSQQPHTQPVEHPRSPRDIPVQPPKAFVPSLEEPQLSRDTNERPQSITTLGRRSAPQPDTDWKLPVRQELIVRWGGRLQSAIADQGLNFYAEPALVNPPVKDWTAALAETMHIHEADVEFGKNFLRKLFPSMSAFSIGCAVAIWTGVYGNDSPVGTFRRLKGLEAQFRQYHPDDPPLAWLTDDMAEAIRTQGAILAMLRSGLYTVRPDGKLIRRI